MVMARRLNELHIWLNKEFVGTWRKKSGREELQYSDEWLASELGRPLSLSLPFVPGNQPHQGESVQYYFDNLLPDSRDIRERLATKFAAHSASPFDLLVELGRDCVGAVQLLKPGEEPEGVDEINCHTLDESDIANILRKTVASNPLGHGSEEGGLRFSLAGAQEKTALLWHDSKWCYPHGATPTTHILKLPLGLVGDMKADMHESVENEWLCSKIVSAFGLPTANSDIAQFEDQKVLVVERFDRRLSSDDSWIIRLPQEDMCQAKGIPPLMKYQADGGLGIAECMRVLDGSSEAVADKQIFFMTQVVFWLLYATDGHAKNFSIQHHSKDAYELAPLYDILSVLPVIGNRSDQLPEQKAKLAMAIRGSKNYYHIIRIERRHFVNQATRVGISAEEAEAMITQILDTLDNVIEYVSTILPDGFPKTVSEKIFEGMRKQAKKLA
jgi:serine/threonine-protein kinase HipA